MTLLQFFLDIGLGLLLGALGGLFGIGGGLLAIPALGLLFGLDQQLAQGTALVMVVPNVLLALRRYHQRNRIDWRHALLLGFSSFCLAWVGAGIAVGLDAEAMRRGFVAFLLALAAWNLTQVYLRAGAGSPVLNRPWPWLGMLGSGSGLVGGLFGVGGAVVATPVLTLAFGVSQVVAQGLALALAAPSTAVALATYGIHGQVDWATGIPLAIGGLLSIGWGVKLAHALPQPLLRGLFSLFLLLCAALLGVKA
ncbi:sulfite exporter TauE/SafE family protein [Pseudomonas sp. GCM10022188]|uniref:sulfite exporter TauE/SafE family protein n=1 Tax=Pseudomonas TaxID=286 RepID=UPI001E287A1C|nr:sulfite exporter TauE/SafE family protein [Pseudomonas oryzagri]MCC6074023.1 sulfite exporter TauE/SafE family protein [Pseudomonas oryzagri]